MKAQRRRDAARSDQRKKQQYAPGARNLVPEAPDGNQYQRVHDGHRGLMKLPPRQWVESWPPHRDVSRGPWCRRRSRLRLYEVPAQLLQRVDEFCIEPNRRAGSFRRHVSITSPRAGGQEWPSSPNLGGSRLQDASDRGCWIDARERVNPRCQFVEHDPEGKDVCARIDARTAKLFG